MINGYLVGDAQLVASMDLMPAAVRLNLGRAIFRLAIKMQRTIKADKLTGQVLGVRTGTLRRSINQRVEDTGNAIMATVGTPVWYARVHEEGGTFQVKQHVRLIKKAWGRTLATPVLATVSAHSATFPARSFLKSTLDDMRAEIEASTQQAVTQGVRDTLRSAFL